MLKIDSSYSSKSGSATSIFSPIKKYMFDSTGSEVYGLMRIEVVGAQDLPTGRRIVGSGIPNPFVTISFSKASFKTKIAYSNLNPVWKEKAYFPVKETECHYSVIFSVYSYEKFMMNTFIGTSSIPLVFFMESPNEIRKLSLELNGQNSSSELKPLLLLKGEFIPYKDLRSHFWKTLAKIYDHDENGCINRVELDTMLESIGSTLTEETVDKLFSVFGPSESEVPIDELVCALESLSVSHVLTDEENIVLLTECPVCYTTWNSSQHDLDVITHLAICTSKDDSTVEKFVMGGFLTEEYASRKWFSKFLSFISYGGYKIGKNNGIILVQNRETGKLTEEKIPSYIRLGLRFMHQVRGTKRAVEANLIKQLMENLTEKQGRKFDDPASVRNIPGFIRYHQINMDEVLEPLESFKTFNEFFYRKLKPNARIIASKDDRVAISPADCRIGSFQDIDSATKLWIKGANFSIKSLLKDELLANYYLGGSLVVCRLAPQDYHRFHSPVDGTIVSLYEIPGTYYTVNPMAVRGKTDVFTENRRTVCLIDSPIFGKVTLVAIGAMMVGSIRFTCVPGQSISRMDELGYFAFGGSTVVVLFPQDSIQFDKDLLENSNQQLETLIKMGDSIGSYPLPRILPQRSFSI